ncbi:hypothetical protein ACIP46_40405 [Streptomyces lavendulae]|uniref:hypothetical protein n=1 Tax=Streptomyces lavendulae TaxID=1914 RepID=UPI0037F7D3E4
MGGAQFLCAALYAQLAALGEEPYGRGYGGGIAVLFWLAVMCVLGSPLALAVGCAHNLLFTTPVMVLSNLAGTRTRISAPWWALPVVGLLAGGYALPVRLLAGTPYAAALGWIAAAGVLPVAVAVLARMRRVPRARVRLWALGPIGVALIAAFLSGAAAPGYRPPVLEEASYVGTWTGDGVRLELGARGEVTARELPVHDGFDVVRRCSGRGTWKPVEADPGDRTGVAVSVPGCEDAESVWQVAGTRERPELFVLMGDPDAGDMAVLRKRPAE